MLELIVAFEAVLVVGGTSASDLKNVGSNDNILSNITEKTAMT